MSINDSPTQLWEEAGAVIETIYLKDTDTPENCVFVKPSTSPVTYRGGIGGVPEYTICAENDEAGGLMYQVGHTDPLYDWPSKFNRIFKKARRIKAYMLNSGASEIPKDGPITVGPNGRCKLWDGVNGREEGRALHEIPIGKGGLVYIKD